MLPLDWQIRSAASDKAFAIFCRFLVPEFTADQEIVSMDFSSAGTNVGLAVKFDAQFTTFPLRKFNGPAVRENF
jgi:hypothetical protein